MYAIKNNEGTIPHCQLNTYIDWVIRASVR
jgi:hypothetical protein